jgi:beta-lactamase class A
MRYFFIFILISLVNTSVVAAQNNTSKPVQEQFKNLEKVFDGKIGVYALNTGNNQIIAYREDERFPIQSTFKLMAVAALLKNTSHYKKQLQQKLFYNNEDLVFWHPVTGNNINNGMTLEELSEAAMSYSDNTAANLIIKKLGGPESITHFAHSLGNQTFNLKHYEPNLNSDPNISDDSATPKDMARSLQKLTLGNILSKPQKTALLTWMRNNTTSYKKMRAAAPIAWVVMDKTGSGNGIANDIGIMWSPSCKPLVLAIYTFQNKSEAKSTDEVVASTTNIILEEFAKHDACFKSLS